MGTFPAIRKMFNPFGIIPGFLTVFDISFFSLHRALGDGAFVLINIVPLAAGLLLGLRLGMAVKEVLKKR